MRKGRRGALLAASLVVACSGAPRSVSGAGEAGAAQAPTVVVLPPTAPPLVLLDPGSPYTERWTDATALTYDGAEYAGDRLSVHPDDPDLGPFVRFGNPTGIPEDDTWKQVGPGMWDQSQPLTISYRFRLNTRDSVWTGQSVFYTSEGSYQAGTLTGPGDRYAGPFDYPIQLYTYPGAIDGAVVASASDVKEVRQTWDPVAGRFTISIDGHARTDGAGDWRPVAFPMTFWWGACGAYQVMDLGPVTITGRRLWGAADQYGWQDWSFSPNVTITTASDGSYDVHGCADPYDCPDLLGGPTARSDWTATSPAVAIPPGFGYAELRLYTQGSVRVRARYADDDANALGGDTDLNAIGTVATSIPWTMKGTRTVDLSRIDPRRPVYLDVRGSADARLAGVWMGFAAR